MKRAGRTLYLPLCVFFICILTVYDISMLGCLLQSSSHVQNQCFHVKVQETYLRILFHFVLGIGHFFFSRHKLEEVLLGFFSTSALFSGSFPVDGDCQRFLLCEQDKTRTNRILGRVFKCPAGQYSKKMEFALKGPWHEIS
jgi:hypothetical protein